LISPGFAARSSDTQAAIEINRMELGNEHKKVQMRGTIISKVQHVLGLYPQTKDSKLKNSLLKIVLEKVEYREEPHQKI
jgi:hypothetical protein